MHARAQVGVIRVAEVNISAAIRDQSDGAATERALQKQWARKLADARRQLSQDRGAAGAAAPADALHACLRSQPQGSIVYLHSTAGCSSADTHSPSAYSTV
jgi:hypothetical protein